MQPHSIIIPSPIRYSNVSPINPMMQYPINHQFGRIQSFGQVRPFGIIPFQYYPNFQQKVIVTKPVDDQRPACVEGEYCPIYSDKHTSKLWHPPRKEQRVVVKKIIPQPPEGETRSACANGAECIIRSKAHHSKLWHPPIPCEFGDKCKFHENKECVYTH